MIAVVTAASVLKAKRDRDAARRAAAYAALSTGEQGQVDDFLARFNALVSAADTGLPLVWPNQSTNTLPAAAQDYILGETRDAGWSLTHQAEGIRVSVLSPTR